MQVDVVTDLRGRRLAVKRAEDADDAARLRREADLLEAATHPGLVELVELVDGPQGSLSTTYLEGGSLQGARGLDAEEVAGAVAAVASTLADLHGLGLVHGAVAPEHVLLDGDGRPVLCSLGYGGLAGERRPAPPMVAAQFVAPASGADQPLHPSMDVYAAGALLSALLAKAHAGARGGPTETLRRIAERATSAAAADRPSARQLADDIHDLVPGARLPGTAAPGRPPAGSPLLNRHRPLETWRAAQLPAAAPLGRRLRKGAVLAAVLGVVAVFGTLALSNSAPEPPPRALPDATLMTAPEPVPSTVAVASPTTAAPPPSPPPTSGRAGCSDVAGPLTADVDGDGCAEAVHFSRGIVAAGGRRWQVGEADDLIAVGDWACSGRRSLAVLRPGTGEVFAFAGWATADGPLEAPLLARVAGGRGLRAADLDADGCNELVVERSEGAPAVLRAPASRR